MLSIIIIVLIAVVYIVLQPREMRNYICTTRPAKGCREEVSAVGLERY